MELHINKRLKALLPPQTKQELEQLKANIDEEGILDPILYWNDGKKDIVIDGMTRYGIAQAGNLAYDTKEIVIEGGIEAVEEWIWKHQSGRRNMSRETIGEWYNALKSSRGGDHTSKVANDTLENVAEKIAEKTGVSVSTVKRDGARVETIATLTGPAQKVAEKATDAEVKKLAKLDQADQNKVARAVRTGQAVSVKDAIQQTGATPEKPDYGKCPNCAGTKWEVGDDGVTCKKCHHPHGEPAGDVDGDRINTQRQKTVKTVEALMRAFDDLQLLLAKPEHDEAIKSCKILLKTAKGWK